MSEPITSRKAITAIIVVWSSLVATVALTGVLLDGEQNVLWASFALSVLVSAGGCTMQIWCLLGRKVKWIPLTLWPLLLFAAAWGIYLASKPRGHALEALILLAALPVSVYVTGLAMLMVARWYSGWRITCDENELEIEPPSRLISIITFVAATTAIILVGGATYAGDLTRVLSFVLMTLLMPTCWMMVLLAVMSRYSIRWIWSYALVLVLAAATTQLALGYFSSPLPVAPMFVPSRPEPGLIKQQFLPSLVGYGFAGLWILVSATYLWKRGVRFRFGGTTGYGASNRGDIAVSHRKLAIGTLALAIVGTGTFGVVYYPRWTDTSWPIPQNPTVADLPRLLQVAGHDAPGVVDPQGREAANRRRKSAETAIQTLGQEAVPLLVQRATTEPKNMESSRQRDVALTQLRILARNRELGPHQTQVLRAAETLLGSSKDFDQVHGANLLLAIGMPDASPIMPAMEKACFAANTLGAGMLLKTFATLAGSDAIPLLRRILEDRENYDISRRTHAATALASVSADVAGPFLVQLLTELRELPSDDLAHSRDLEQLANAAGTTRTAAAIPHLISFLHDERLNPDQREAIIRAFGNLGSARQDVVQELKAIVKEEVDIDPKTRRLAIVALCRNYVPQAEKAIPAAFEKIADHLPSYGENEDLIDPSYTHHIGELRAYMHGLMLLGAHNDPAIMSFQASPSWNGNVRVFDEVIRSAGRNRLVDLLVRTMEPLAAGQNPLGAAPNEEWTIDGQLMALSQAASIAMESTNPSVRCLAANILLAIGPATPKATAILQRHLNDDNPEVQTRVAAALARCGDA